MRLFVAIALATGVAARIAELRRPLMARALEAHWAQAESWHLTLQFLDERAEAELPAVAAALARVRRAPFPLELRGLGAFPPAGRTRTVWIGLADPGPVTELAAAVAQALAPMVQAEERPYTPHLTLARAGPRGNDLAALRTALNPAEPVWGAQETREFSLFWSRPSRGRYQYEVLRTFPLRA